MTFSCKIWSISARWKFPWNLLKRQYCLAVWTVRHFSHNSSQTIKRRTKNERLIRLWIPHTSRHHKAAEWYLIRDVFSVLDSTYRNLDSTNSFRHIRWGRLSHCPCTAHIPAELCGSASGSAWHETYTTLPCCHTGDLMVVTSMGWQRGNDVNNEEDCCRDHLRAPVIATIGVHGGCLALALYSLFEAGGWPRCHSWIRLRNYGHYIMRFGRCFTKQDLRQLDRAWHVYFSTVHWVYKHLQFFEH